MKKRYWILSGLASAATLLYLNNASWLASPQRERPYFIAHRGVHQAFDPIGVGPNDCTAILIEPPSHPFIENTLLSMAAAFESGAHRVEIDIHPTTDGEFAVFHDWTLECRTDGDGPVRAHSMLELRQLDVGHGYTADGGQTWPLRGLGVGLMPTLAEALHSFPDRNFLINVKSNDPAEADQLDAYFDDHAINTDRLIVMSAPRPDARLAQLRPDLRRMSRSQVRQCGLAYMAWGWSGHVPEACHNTVLALPANYAHLAWGWPNRLEARLTAVNSELWVFGDLDRQSMNSTGVDTQQALNALPSGFRGGISTNRIELLGPESVPQPTDP